MITNHKGLAGGIMAVMGMIALQPVGYAATAKQEVRAVLDQIFDAMRSGDGATLSNILLPEAPLDRISPDKPLHHGKASGWIDWVNTLKPGEADEQIFDVKINIEGPLATAWAPFTIAINGEMKSCGVNHFTLVNLDGAWKVAYLIDTHTPEKCGDMIKVQKKAAH